MTEAMIEQTFYRGINTTNQYVVNQLAGGNFTKLPYAEACEILDEMTDTTSAWQSRANVPQGDPHIINLHKELQDHGQAIAELTTTMDQLAKAQLQQIQGPKQVNTMEGVNLLVNKRRQHGQQMQVNQDHYEQGSSGYNQDDGPPIFHQPNNPPPFLPQGPSSSNNEIGRIESIFEQMMKKNANSDAQLASHNTFIRNLEVQLCQISQALNTRPKWALPSDKVVHSKGGNNTDHTMVVTTRSGRGGEASTSKQKEVMSDDVEVHNEDDPIVVEQVSKGNVNGEVRIDIHDNEEETQNDMNPSREHVIDMPEMVMPKSKAPLPRPPPPYPQRLTKQKNKNQFKKFIEMIKSLSINVPLVKALEQIPGYAKFIKDLDPLEAVLLNHDVTEDEGLVEYVNALHDMGSYSYEPRKLSLDLENRKTPQTKPSIKEPPILELKPFPPYLR
uniref:Uncharacterized protein LOC104217801 n=1 Tax=Nicotiana sylvestris TaxID=4096 RepID=A0A1U7VED8_NICSY|nr:PREDICTED: uncharacterized protein LOC104217801 [Nicotiana sylvestris]